jgi:hypothetical protein
MIAARNSDYLLRNQRSKFVSDFDNNVTFFAFDMGLHAHERNVKK